MIYDLSLRFVSKFFRTLSSKANPDGCVFGQRESKTVTIMIETAFMKIF